MQKLIDGLIKRIDRERLKELTLDMVRIPSPPYQERAVAEFYAHYLSSIGLTVELDDEYPTSPSVIAWLYGANRNGPTLQLDGHTDAIDLPGPEPRFADGYIYGRGSEDMKASLAAMAEAARVIVEAGVRLRGNLLLTAHGRHESATNETLESLIAKGVHGDAVIVTELGGHDLPIAGMGLAFFTLEITRDGEILHETVAPPATPHPINAGQRALQLIHERAQILAQQTMPYLGTESIFVGKIQAGDYFNRLPKSCTILGTRRFGPQQRMSDIQVEFDQLARQLEAETDTHVTVHLEGIEGFQIPENEPIVRSLQQAYQHVTGQTLPLAGTRTAANVPQFVHLAHVPAVYYGVTYLTAHSDHERVALAEMMRATKVYVHTIINYLGIEGTNE